MRALLVGVLLGGAALLAVAALDLRVDAVAVLALVVAASLALSGLRRLRVPADPEPSLGPRPDEQQPDRPFAALARLEELVSLGGLTRRQWDRLLRPVLRDLAREQLHHHRGIDLDTEPDRARRALGDELWQWIESQPGDPDAPGPGPAELLPVVRRLADLSP